MTEAKTIGSLGLREAASIELIAAVDRLRTEATKRTSAEDRSTLGQFPTPPGIATFMASLFDATADSIRVLDAGAGVGSLTAAFVAKVLERKLKPNRIESVAFEVDQRLAKYAERTLHLCRTACEHGGVAFSGELTSTDFIEAAVEMIGGGLFKKPVRLFNYAILNPPYRKIDSGSSHRGLLRQVGIETSNLYTAFLALVMMLLEPGGELVAITPRSFCNGPYFKSFRQMFLREMSLRRIHVFESRSEAFSEDEVLQENIIFHAVKTPNRQAPITISSSHGPCEEPTSRVVPYDEVFKIDDPDQFIHIVTDDEGRRASSVMKRLTFSLDDLGLSVSTGRVVDFRCREFLRPNPGPDTVPLIYPTHFSNGWIAWPKLGHKKPNACLRIGASERWLIPAAVHVLVKRFSAKEERRRIVASVFDPDRIQCNFVAFENHVNYFHEGGRGLSRKLAKGLALFLNSTLVDTYFRQFNGHTQVNAADLRNLKYPARSELEDLGDSISDVFPIDGELDRLVEEELLGWRRDQSRQSVPA